MRVHLPDGGCVTRWTDPAAWQAERLAAFGPAAEPFWRWQESTADRMWDLAQAAPWPPQGLAELARLAARGVGLAAAAPARLPGLALDALRPVAARLASTPVRLRQYVDGQLLISAQATSERANALYAAASLDMPRARVAHVRGGMGKLAEALAEAVRRHGGRVHYPAARHACDSTARRRLPHRDRQGSHLRGRQVVFNLPPHDAAALLGEERPPKLRRAVLPADGWGAFMLYVGPGWGHRTRGSAAASPGARASSRWAKATASFCRSACPTMRPAAPPAIVP